MGQYDNYSNEKRIKLAQKRLDKLKGKKKQDPFKIDMAKKELEQAKLFESCQIFKSFNGRAPNTSILFSDDNKVILFGDKLIPYEQISSYQMIENTVQMSHTTTKRRGVIPRAIIGGAIAGGVGAILGAASAGSESNTIYADKKNGFFFQIFLKNGKGYQLYVENNGVITNKVHPKWIELCSKLQIIIDNQKKYIIG